MGFWAKDGSYQYDESDIELREAMNETQGQRYDREQRAIREDYSSPFTPEEEAKREEAYARRVDERAKWYAGNREYRKQQEQRKVEENQRELQKQAFENAKTRYIRLSPITKLCLKIVGKDIVHYSDRTSVETLDSLYRGKAR